MSYRPSLPGHTPQEIAERSQLITSFHNVLDISSFVPDVAGWLNRITPASKGSFSAGVVEAKLKSSLGKAFDEGIALETADGSFGVRLWPVPVGKPVSGAGNWVKRGKGGSTLAAGKAELRWFAYREAGGSRFDGSLFLGEVLGGYQAGVGVKGEVGGQVLHSRQWGSRSFVSNNPARYQFLRMKEDGGRVEVDVAWVARVQDRATGRWRDFTFTTAGGDVRRDTVPYLVAQALLPHDETLRNNGGPSDPAATGPDAHPHLVDPDYLVPKQISDRSEFPLEKLDFAVTRLDLVARVMTVLRQQLSPDDFAFWGPVVEGKLNNTDLAIKLDKLRYSGDDIQRMFRINEVRGGRSLNLTLTDAQITSVVKRSEVDMSNELRFDDIRGNIARSMAGADRGRRAGGGFFGQIKIPRGLRFGFGVRHRWHRGQEAGRNHRALITSSKRLGGLLQAVGFDFAPKLNVEATSNGEVTSRIDNVVVDGGSADALLAAVDVYHLRRADGQRLFVANPKLVERMQAEVAKPDAGSEKKRTLSQRMVALLDAMGAPAPRVADGVVEPAKDRRRQQWWRPGAGLGMDHVEKIDGNRAIYNRVVPRLVDLGYLPAAARGEQGQTPFQALAQVAGPTGAGINKPDQAHRNWVRLVDELADDNLLSRRVDLFGAGGSRPGVTIELPHPDAPTDPSRTLLGGLSAEVTGSRFVEMTPYEIQVAVTDMDIIYARNVTGGLTNVDGVGRDPGAPNPVPAGATARRTTYPSAKQGRNLSSYLTADTDGQKLPAARYRADLRLHLFGLIGDGEPMQWGSVKGSADVLQPDVLADPPPVDGTPLPPLPETDETALLGAPVSLPEGTPSVADETALVAGPPQDGTPSPRTPSALATEGIQIYAIADPTGFAELSAGLVATGRVGAANVWKAFTPSLFTSLVLRSLFGAGTLPVGPVTIGLQTRLLGRPRVDKFWFPYNQQVQEGQDGAEQGRMALVYNDVIVRGGLGLDSEAARWLPDRDGWTVGVTGTGRFTVGSGQEHSRVDTLGNYRAGYQDNKFVWVRSEVEFTVPVPGGPPVVHTGEVFVNVRVTDVQRHRAKFDDPYRLVPAGEPADSSAPLWGMSPLPPASLTDNHSFSTMWIGQHTSADSASGHGPLIADLTAKAAQLGGDDLANKVASLPTWTEASVAQLRDGGKGWLIESGGRRFYVLIEARPIGKAENPQDGPTGLKVYRRDNEANLKARREIDGFGYTAAVAAGGQGVVPDAVVLRGGASSGKYQRNDVIDGVGGNDLRMEGARLNKTAQFDQDVVFEYIIEEIKSERGGTFGALRGVEAVSGEVVENKAVAVPLETLRLRNQPPVGLNIPLTTRPLDMWDRVAGAYGVKAIFDAVDSTGLLTKQHAYHVHPSATQLTNDKLAKNIGPMMTEHGKQFTSLVSGNAAYDNVDITVRAELNPSLQVSTVSKAELEKYDHETVLMQQANQAIQRKTHTLTGGASIPADPSGATRGNIDATGAYAQVGITRTDVTASTEVRNWNRGDNQVYLIYIPVTYDITVRKGDKTVTVTAYGATEITTTKDNALKFGIPETVLTDADNHATLLRELTDPAPKVRDRADDRALKWITQHLPGEPTTAPTAPTIPRHDTDTPQTRAGRTRRLLAPTLPPGWTTTGPLTQRPPTLRPGTRLWIARPLGAAAARIDTDGTYRLLDPLTPAPPNAPSPPHSSTTSSTTPTPSP
ncbi:hypothetical protein JD77_04543 [Micromonospora olivasterospora]|uniref:Uncharacterized protein n=1 Tax=Micromonospora olivasterospora TaxID=1880 RepID=A0A562IFM2_MICOL|nr:hypothetical protein JD77_04543 [Micromonospora olivasterospora]